MASPQIPIKRRPELILRTFSALVLIAVSLLATWFGGTAFWVLCAAGSALVLVEFCTMTPAAGARYVLLAGFIVFLVIWLGIGPAAALTAALVIVALAGFVEFQRNRSIWAATGLVYAIAPFSALILLRGELEPGLHAVLMIFACVWGADTVAYFAGRKIGGPKLAPRISPNKTWSGFIGGLVGAVLVALLIEIVLGYDVTVGLFILALPLALFSVFGDLFESWTKRRFGVKDSGVMIPGHGGVLDRVDGLIFSCVVAWFIGWIVGGNPLQPGSTGEALINAFLLP